MSDITTRLYSFPLSGNSHRVELALSLLGVDYNLNNVDLKQGEQRSTWFTELNPKNKVPVLVDHGTVLTESISILTYLAEKYDDGTWMPSDPILKSEVYRWFTLASTDLASGPAAARLITLFGAPYNQEETMAKAHSFLLEVDAALAQQNYLIGDHPSFADIAIYSYVAHAPEGHVSLDQYTNIIKWLARFEALDGFIKMTSTPVKSAA